MSFSKAGETMLIIDHTDVSEHLRCQGIGEKLARYMVEEARNRKLKIIPLCPFVTLVFDKNPELGASSGNIRKHLSTFEKPF